MGGPGDQDETAHGETPQPSAPRHGCCAGGRDGRQGGRAAEYDSALKRTDVLPPATMWMDLEDTSQTQGHVLCDPTRGRSPEESESETVAGGGEGSECIMGTECQCGTMRKSWRWMVRTAV